MHVEFLHRYDAIDFKSTKAGTLHQDLLHDKIIICTRTRKIFQCLISHIYVIWVRDKISQFDKARGLSKMTEV